MNIGYSKSAPSLTVLNRSARDGEALVRDVTNRQAATARITIRPGRVSLQCAQGRFEALVPADPRSVIWHYLDVWQQVRSFVAVAAPEPLELVVVLGEVLPYDIGDGGALGFRVSERLQPIEHQQLEALRMAYLPYGRLLFQHPDGGIRPLALPTPEPIGFNPGWRLDIPLPPHALDLYVEDGRISAMYRGQEAEAPLASSATFRISRAEPVYHALERFRRELRLPNRVPVFVYDRRPDNPAPPGEAPRPLSDLEWHVIADACQVMRMGVVNGPQGNPLRVAASQERGQPQASPLSLTVLASIVAVCMLPVVTGTLKNTFGTDGGWLPIAAVLFYIAWAFHKDAQRARQREQQFLDRIIESTRQG